MSVNEKSLKLIIKLTRETAKNSMLWQVKSPPKSLTYATDDEIFTYFYASYKDKVVAIFVRKYKHYHDEDDFSWSERNVFAVLDYQDRVLIEFDQYSPALTDLFTIVREKVSNLDGLLDDLLG